MKPDTARLIPWRSAEVVIDVDGVDIDDVLDIGKFGNEAIVEAMKNADIAQDIKRRARIMGFELGSTPDRTAYCIVPLQRPERFL